VGSAPASEFVRQRRCRSRLTLSPGHGALALITGDKPAPAHRPCVVPPRPSPEPDCCGSLRQADSVQGRRSRSRSDAGGALYRFRLARILLRRFGEATAFPPACHLTPARSSHSRTISSWTLWHCLPTTWCYCDMQGRGWPVH